MSVQGFVFSLMRGARGKDAAKALILPQIFGESAPVAPPIEVNLSGSQPLDVPYAKSKPMEHLITDIVPWQDLNGYSSPWPAGGGVNKLPVTSDNVVLGKYISNSGTVTSNANNFYVNQYIPVTPSTEYGLTISTPISYCSVMEYDEDKTFITRTLFTCSGSTQYATETQVITLGATTKYVLIGANLDNSSVTMEKVLSYKYQFQTGMFNGFTPYENICPIHGWDTITAWNDAVMGGNIEWNQLESNGKFDTGNGWGNAAGGDAVFSNNEVTLTFTSNPSKEYTAALIRRNFSNPANHKVVISMDVYVPRSGAFNYDSNGTLTPNSGKIADTEANKWTHIALIATSTGVTQGVYVFPKAITNGYEAGDSYKITNFNIFDLTQMFGSGNEPSTVDEFRALFPLDYYPYNAGTTTCVSAVNNGDYWTVPVTFGALGKNLLNPQNLRAGNFDTIVQFPSSNICTDDLIPIVPNTAYTFNQATYPDGSFGRYLRFYDESKTQIDAQTSYVKQGWTFTTPANARYAKFMWYQGSSQYTSTDELMAQKPQLEEGTSATTYEPYTATVYGGTYDFVTGDGTLTWAEKDLGDLTWTYNTTTWTSPIFYASVSGAKNYSQSMCSAYPRENGVGSLNDHAFATSNNNYVYIRESNYTDAQTFSTAVAGQQYVYQLSTPIPFHVDKGVVITPFSGNNHIWTDCGTTLTADYTANPPVTELTLSGSTPLELPNAAKAELTGAQTDIVATQSFNGYDKPWPAGGGKNKYNTAETAWSNGTVILDDNGDPTTSVASHYTTNYTKVAPSTGYTLSGTIVYGTTLTGRIYFYDSDKHWISRTSAMQFDDADGVQFTTPATCEYIQIQTASETTADWMLEIGSTPSTWSPYSNSCPIVGWKGAKVSVSNANMMPTTAQSREYGGITYTVNADGSVHCKGLSTSTSWLVGSDGATETYIPAGTYTLSGGQANVGLYIAGKHVDGTGVSNVTIGGVDTGNGLTFTLTQGANVHYQLSIQNGRDVDVVIKPMLNSGSTALPYKPYTGSTASVTFGPLTKNLLNLDRTVEVTTGTQSSSTARQFAENQVWIGLSFNNYMNNARIDTYQKNGNSITVGANSTAYGVTYPIKCKPETRYTVSTASNPKAYVAIGQYDSDGNYIDCSSRGTGAGIVTASNAAWITVCLCPTEADGDVTYTNIMANEGTTTPYEPYKDTLYGGTADVRTGAASEDTSVIDMGDILWTADTNRAGVFYGAITGRKNNSGVIRCESYEVYNQAVSTSKDCYVSGFQSYGSGVIFFRDTRFTTQEEARTGTKGIMLEYELNTPVSHTIPTASLSTSKGTNYAWSDCGTQMTVKYMGKGVQ